jgi:hypothetical protein
MKGTIKAVILLISIGLVFGFVYQELHPSLGESVTAGGIQFTTLTPHHLGNMFNPSLSSRSITFFGTSVIMPCPPTSKW